MPALAQSLTIQGKVLDGSNNPVTGSGTIFRVQILSPDTQRCVLFDETHTVNLSGTGGLFSINLADSTGTANAPNNYSLEQALSNRAAFSVNSSYCASGSGTLTYTPGANDNRKVVIQFRDPGTMTTFETIPEMDLNPVAWAMESRTVGGFPAASVLRVVAGGVPGTAPTLTTGEAAELQALVGGTSTKYMARDLAGGARIPTYPGDPTAPATGSLWFDSTGSGALKYKDSAGAIQTVGSGGGGGGTITSITASGALTGGGSSGAVTVSLPTTGVTGFGSAVGSATSVPVITYDSYGRLTTVTTAPISGTLPSGTNGEFLKYSAGAWGSAAVRMSDIKNATGAAALFGSTTCSASETFYWDSGTDQFKCQPIALGAPSSTVAATYTKVTVAADGRVNGGSATIGNSDIADLAWSKLTSVPSLVTNGGSASSLVANNTGSKPAGQIAGRIYVDVSNQKISYDNGTAWVDVSGSASATPSVSVSAPLTSTSGTIGITQASGSTDGYLSSASFTAFTNKLSKALASAHIFVGNGSGDATDVAVGGDLSLTNTGAFTVNAIKGTPLSAVPSATGQVLRYDGTNYAPTLLSLADIRSNVTGSNTFTTTCSAGQTLTWNSGSDTLQCQNISVAAASQISGTLGVANGGTGAATTSQGFVFAGPSSGAGAPAFRALAAADLPAEAKLWAELSGNVFRGTGNVGIGTSAPSSILEAAMNGSGNTIATLPGIRVSNLNSTQGDGTSTYNFATLQARAGNGAINGDLLAAYNSTGYISGIYLRTLGAYPLNLQTNALTRMTIDPTGNVGIGSTSPAATLDVNGSVALAYGSGFKMNGAGWHNTTFLSNEWDGTGDHLYLQPAGNSNSVISLLTAVGNQNATEKVRIDSFGNVGIGTTAPTVSLDFNTRTDAVRLPAGDASQQPGQSGMAAAANGMIRYNTTSNSLEAYVNGAWTNLATVGGTQSFAGNVSVGGTFTSTGAATFNGGATIAGGALAMSSQNITGVGANITGSGALTVASGGTNTSLTLRSSGTGAVNVGSSNGTGLSVLDGGASTVNYVTVKGAAAGASPVIGAAGADTNVNLTISPKGTGITNFATGKVGIGTSVPMETLDILGGHTFHTGGDIVHGFNGYFGGSPTSWRNHGYNGGGNYGAIIDFVPPSGKLHFTISNATAATDAAYTMNQVMSLQANGYVGIGNTAPNSQLANTSTNTTDALWGAGTSGITWITNAPGWTQSLSQASTASNANGLLVKTAGTATTNSILQLESGGTNRVVVRGDGNMGVGVTSPASKLSVAGDISVGNNMIGGSVESQNFTLSSLKLAHYGITVGQGPLAGGPGLHVSGYYGIPFYTNGLERMRVDSGGNVAIGTTSADANLKIASGATDGVPAFSFTDNEQAATMSTLPDAFGGSVTANMNVGMGDVASINRWISTAGNPTKGFTFWQQTGVGAFKHLMTIQGSTGNVGIGTTNPGHRLTNQSANIVDQGGAGEAGTNTFSWSHPEDGAWGYAAAIQNAGTTSGNSGLLVKIANSTSSERALTVTSNGVDRFVVRGDGAVGIGTTAPNSTLDLGPGVTDIRTGLVYFVDHNNTANKLGRLSVYAGEFSISRATTGKSFEASVMNQNLATGNMWIAGTLSQASDARLKRDITPLNGSLAKILQLEGVTYHWIDPSRDPNLQLGLIAQDVEKIFPEAVSTNRDGYRSVAYSNLIAPVINAIKELTHLWEKDSAEKASRLEALEKENAQMKAWICKQDPAAGFCGTRSPASSPAPSSK